MRIFPLRICLLRICLLVVLSTSCLVAEPNVVIHVKTRVHADAKDRVLVEKGETLTFDDAQHRLILTGSASKRLDIAYDDVAKIVFEVTTHMRGGTLAEMISFAGAGGAIAGNILAGKHVNDYWFTWSTKARRRRQRSDRGTEEFVGSGDRQGERDLRFSRDCRRLFREARRDREKAAC